MYVMNSQNNFLNAYLQFTTHQPMKFESSKGQIIIFLVIIGGCCQYIGEIDLEF